MREHLDYDLIDHIVISHMHADHFFDLIPLRYALLYGPRKRHSKVGVWLPPGGDAMLRTLVSAFADEGAGDFLNAVFDIRMYNPTETLTFGAAKISFAPCRHYIPTFALRYTNDGRSITYSADTAPNEAVSRLARESMLFICEATLLPEEVEHGVRGHSSALEAGEMARQADAQRLMLTHYPSETSQEELIVHARSTFRGQIVVADDHTRFSL